MAFDQFREGAKSTAQGSEKDELFPEAQLAPNRFGYKQLFPFYF
jgi:hypothetical protein